MTIHTYHHANVHPDPLPPTRRSKCWAERPSISSYSEQHRGCPAKGARSGEGVKDIKIGGGAGTVKQYIQAGHVGEESTPALAPVALGQGESLFNGAGSPHPGVSGSPEHVPDGPGHAHRYSRNSAARRGGAIGGARPAKAPHFAPMQTMVEDRRLPESTSMPSRWCRRPPRSAKPCGSTLRTRSSASNIAPALVEQMHAAGLPAPHAAPVARRPAGRSADLHPRRRALGRRRGLGRLERRQQRRRLADRDQPARDGVRRRSIPRAIAPWSPAPRVQGGGQATVAVEGGYRVVAAGHLRHRLPRSRLDARQLPDPRQRREPRRRATTAACSGAACFRAPRSRSFPAAGT